MEKTYTKNKYNQCFFVCMSLLPHTLPAIFTQVCAKREKCSGLKGSIWLEQVVELLPMVVFFFFFHLPFSKNGCTDVFVDLRTKLWDNKEGLVVKGGLGKCGIAEVSRVSASPWRSLRQYQARLCPIVLFNYFIALLPFE